MKWPLLLLLLVAAALPVHTQDLGPSLDSCISCASHGPVPTVTFTSWGTSNDNASNGHAPTRKQLGNVGTGCSAGVIGPAGFPVGQLYATSAIKTAAVAAGCANQGVVAVTASGTGIAALDNGKNAGGTDSPVTVTGTYGGSSTDTACTGDPQYSAVVGTIIHDIPMPACHPSSSSQFALTTSLNNPAADFLWPTNYTGPSLDASLYIMRVIHFRINNLADLHDLEFDTNYNTSAGYYNGWGMHWSDTAVMLQVCPQGCTGWKTTKLSPVGGGAVVTTYPLTVNHWYTFAFWYHREATCTPSSLVNCYFYDFAWLYDATAATTPTLYAITDTTGSPVGGIPQDRSTWTKPLMTTQWQIDPKTTNPVHSPSVDVDSDTTSYYTK